MADRRLTRNFVDTGHGGTAKDAHHLWLHPMDNKGIDRHASNHILVAHYNFLLKTPTFRRLNQIVTANQAIVLEDRLSQAGPCYKPKKHIIAIPLKNEKGHDRRHADIRADILFEMHNASLRGAHARLLESQVDDPGASAPFEDRKMYRYKQAALALSIEWIEWINIVEIHYRSQAINDELTRLHGQRTYTYIESDFTDGFAKPDQGWFLFSEYLTDQRKLGHTVSYDPAAAAGAKWVGGRILRIAKAISPRSLIITDKQVRDWLSEKTTKVKSPSNNPFTSHKIVEQAMGRSPRFPG